jgi:hypothetical protein
MNVANERREVFEEIYGVNRFSDILEQFENDYNSCKNKGLGKIQDLYKRYSYAIFFMYSPSSIRNNLVKFKNVIKANGGKYQSNAIETFTIDAIYAPIKAKDEEVKKELKAKVKSGENTNIDPQTIVTQIEDLKRELDDRSYKISNNQKEEQVRAYRIVAMLGLSTGRRFTELMKTLVISKKGTKITFDGLLKGNDNAIEGNIIGLSYLEVKKHLNELREYAKTEDMTESEVNSKYAKVFNNAMKRIGVGNVKSTRHNYSVAGSQLFKRENETLEDTITRILGHKEVFTSALNYT